MKTILLAIGIILLFMFLLKQDVQKPEVLIPYPEYASVVVNDGRSVCEKKADMTLQKQWIEKCGGEKCSLQQADVYPLQMYKAWYVDKCE